MSTHQGEELLGDRQLANAVFKVIMQRLLSFIDTIDSNSHCALKYKLTVMATGTPPAWFYKSSGDNQQW